MTTATGHGRPLGQDSCSDCRLASLCLPIALEAGEIRQLDQLVQRRLVLQRGDPVYSEDAPFTSVYAVRSGSVKAYRIVGNDREQVTGFYFPGEILGMDGISKNRHVSSAVALETTSICEIPFERLGELSTRLPSLQRHFFQLMSQEITEDQQLITLLGKSSAEQRVATLLLSIAARNARRRLSATQFRLPMSRTDIGNYLGLTLETVSRIFSRFQKLGLLAVDGKEVHILDSEQLSAYQEDCLGAAKG